MVLENILPGLLFLTQLLLENDKLRQRVKRLSKTRKKVGALRKRAPAKAEKVRDILKPPLTGTVLGDVRDYR